MFDTLEEADEAMAKHGLRRRDDLMFNDESRMVSVGARIYYYQPVVDLTPKNQGATTNRYRKTLADIITKD